MSARSRTGFGGMACHKFSPYDPLSLSLVSAVLVAIGVFSSWLPAHRATRVNPTEALRSE